MYSYVGSVAGPGSRCRASALGEGAWGFGVRRISIGSGFSRAAITAFLHAAREVIDHGIFAFTEETLYMSEIAALFDSKGLV
jgi:2-methylisocitrate lyase-like PEP mutase family enzyme